MSRLALNQHRAIHDRSAEQPVAIRCDHRAAMVRVQNPARLFLQSRAAVLVTVDVIKRVNPAIHGRRDVGADRFRRRCGLWL